jgi:hypothetical protein
MTTVAADAGAAQYVVSAPAVALQLAMGFDSLNARSGGQMPVAARQEPLEGD